VPPLPKKKYPKARQGDRRRHLAVKVPTTLECPHCHELMVSHRTCPHCGYYKGEQVIDVARGGKPVRS
jgi:large subunit ribosomal protein L32